MIETWPEELLGQAMQALARAAGLPVRRGEPAGRPPESAGASASEQWLEQRAARLGLEVEHLGCVVGELEGLLRCATPLLCRARGIASPEYVSVVRVTRGHAVVIGPGGRRRVPLGQLVERLRPATSDAVTAECAEVARRTGLTGDRRACARAALIAARERDGTASGLHRLRLPAEAPFMAHLRRDGVIGQLIGFAGTYAVYYSVWLVSWWLLTRWIAATGDARGWLSGWLLALATSCGLRAVAMHRAGALTLDLGGAIRERALTGTLRLPFAAVQRKGIGDFLGRVLELGSTEAEGLRGAFNVAFATLELLIAITSLSLLGGWIHAGLLTCWIAVTVAIGRWYARSRSRWRDARLQLAHDLIEDLVGHTSCLVQRRLAARLAADDHRTASYLEGCPELDRRALVLCNAIPRGWLLLSSLGLVPVVVGGAGSSTIAIAMGASILAFRAFRPFAEGLALLVDAVTSWRSVAPLLGVATPAGGHGELTADGEDGPAATATGLTCRTDARSLFEDCSFSVAAHDRIIVEGASGAGKSTLGLVLAGLHAPNAGTVLVAGRDLHTVGLDRWRQAIAYTPQLGRNHLFQGSLAFNLVLGRGWPATNSDVAEAERVCRDLGLGSLLESMPAGIHTVIGETGWQLSHGERARVFLARSLLQRARLVILDESLSSLDPASIERTVAYLGRRPEAVMLVAHG